LQVLQYTVFCDPSRQGLLISLIPSKLAGIKAGSKPSIISSTLASILLAIAYKVIDLSGKDSIDDNVEMEISSQRNGTADYFGLQKTSLPIALGTTVALSVVFFIRFLKTKKIVPAGILGLFSLGFSIFFSVLKWNGAA
jgi:uncharacterized membrane protein (UPF0136 family)